MRISLRNYTLRYLVVSILVIIAVWAALFYAYILDEVYDNIDDGLRNSKIQIIREAYKDPKIYKVNEFGISQFRITPLANGEYSYQNTYSNTLVYMEYDEDNEPVRTLSTVFRSKEGKPYQLEIRTSTIEEDDLLEDLFEALIILYIMLVISIAIIQRIVLKKVWNSFYNLLDKLNHYKIGSNAAFEILDSPVIEFHDLGIELKEMLRRNESIYLRQNQFIGNAAHELQTPLAIAINKLELFMEQHEMSEEQWQGINEVSDTLVRLVRLNKSLLMLSKIENKQFIDKEEVNFNHIVAKLLGDYDDLLNYKNITISIETKGEFIFTMNNELAYILVSNLLKNAYNNNKSNGEIAFVISAQSFIIKNTSDAPPLDANLIFERFYKNAKNKNSVGLGLSVVRSIIATYDKLGIQYNYEGERHTFNLYKKG